jgi:Tol biopolymer transport system component
MIDRKETARRGDALAPRLLAFAATLLAAACATALVYTAGSAQTQPAGGGAASVSLFAEGVVSTPEDELNSAFSPDGKSLYFTKNAPGSRQGVIVVSRLANGKWGKPEVAPFSGRYSDYDPFFAPDGSRLFFISNRPVSGTARRRDFDIWVVERAGGGWGEPRDLGAPVDTDRNEYYPSVAADGTLYFSTDRQGGRGGFDLYRSRFVDGKFAEPENLGDANTQFSEIDSYVAPDQSFIVFASYGRPDSLGGGDLYVSVNRGGKWSPAVNLGAPINSAAREYCPAGSPDGRYFYFTSERGFADDPPPKPFTYAELEARLRGVLNGRGNVLRTDMAAVKAKAAEIK